MSKQRTALLKYFNSVAKLFDLLRKNIQKDGVITNASVLALNEAIIAENEIKELTEELKNIVPKRNGSNTH